MVQNSRSLFVFLLTALLLLLVLQPQVVAWPQGLLVLSFLATLLQVAAIVVLAEDRRLRVFAWVFGLPALVAIWGRHYVDASSQETAMLWAHGLTSIFLAVTAVLILRYVMTHDITANSIVAAICAYLLIGVVIGHLCFMAETLDPGAYRSADNLSGDFTNPDSRASLLMYYSFSTLTTTGYGDIVPNRPLTRTMAWMEAATGQLYLAILIAGVVSMRVNQKLTKPPGSRSHGGRSEESRGP